MALDTKDKVYGSIIATVILGSAAYVWGTQYDHDTGSKNARIAGEAVDIVTYENKVWGGGRNIRVEGTTYSQDAYMDRLEGMVEKALEEK